MKIVQFVAFFALSLFGAPLAGQLAVQVQKAELSVPFGSVPGKLVIAGDTLIFVDEQNPEASFGVSRDNIQEVRTEGGAIVVALRESVRDRSGERSRLSFRMAEDAGSGALAGWFGRKKGVMATAPGAATGAQEEERTLSYQVRHDHRFGGCQGQLMITDGAVVYESVSKVGDSRRWDMKDIKEVDLNNPYELVIVPFRGDTYKFNLQRKGMGGEEYSFLEQQVASARADL